MSTKKDEVKTTTGTANPTGSTVDYKNYSSTGWGGTADLAKYGIDYSQEQRDAIANIFRDQATAAYGTAQNQFSNSMAQQQATLSDTIRRSQAQAVATGASRGMQAANELSSMLGLQQAAAQETSAMQGTYAEALANAQKNAYDVQNAANQVAMQGYVADSASNAQMYVANMEDPYRVFSVAAELKAAGQTQAADAILQSYYKGMGYTADEAAGMITQSNLDSIQVTDSKGNPIEGVTEWSPGNDGLVSGKAIKDYGSAAEANYKDLANGKSEDFEYKLDGISYRLRANGDTVTVESNPTLYKTLNTISGAGSSTNGAMVYYNGKAYISAKGKWREITGTGGVGSGYSYNTFMAKLSGKYAKNKETK